MPRYFKDRAERQAAEAAYKAAYAQGVEVFRSLGYKLARKRGEALPRKLRAADLAAFMAEHRATEEWLKNEDARWAMRLKEISDLPTVH